MALNACVFAVQLPDPEALEPLRRRAEQLLRFYAPLGRPLLRTRFVADPRVLVGEIDFGGGADGEPGDMVLWGGPLPARLRTATALLEASDGQLRDLLTVTTVVASEEGRVRIVAGAGGVTTLYERRSGGLAAWSTHAVAASWLAAGSAEIDPPALAELIGCEFVGDERTLLRGVRALPAASVVDLDRAGAGSRSYWPVRERWAPLPPDEAYDHAQANLLEAARSHIESEHTFAGLTAGLDSRVVAAALTALGVPFRTFTWGDPAWDDVSGAQRVAAQLGVVHQLERIDWQADEDALRRVDAEVRWHEGAIPVTFGRNPWPQPIGTMVTGGGGEIGRCFYYRGRAHTYREPGNEVLARGMPFEGRLSGARPEAIEHVRERTAAWLEEAAQCGHRGWSRLDVLYGEQRVRRWGRGMVSRHPERWALAFAAPEVARGLASMPLAARAVDGFHRRFLERHAPALALPAAKPFAEAGAMRSRLRGAAAPLLRPAATLARRRDPHSPVRWWAADAWSEHPGFFDFISGEVLESPLLGEALGEDWLRHVRDGLGAGNLIETESALLAGAPVLLARALDRLAAG